MLKFDREGFFLPHLRLQPIFQSFSLGQIILDALLALFPSQAAGLYFCLSKEG